MRRFTDALTELTVALLVLGFAMSCVQAEPRIISTHFGVYADPSDNTSQCLAAPHDRLCIGNQFSAVNWEDLMSKEITHIVSAIGQLGEPIPDIQYHTVYYEDTSQTKPLQHWEAAAQFIKQALDSHPTNRILIHCAAGVSRSSSTLIYYLMKEHNMKFSEAFRLVKDARSVIRPNKGFTAELLAYEKTDRSIQRTPIKITFKMRTLREPDEQYDIHDEL